MSKQNQPKTLPMLLDHFRELIADNEERGNAPAMSEDEVWTPLRASEAKLLLEAYERMREALLRIACRDYSKSDLDAHVADALGITVAEVEAIVDHQ